MVDGTVFQSLCERIHGGLCLLIKLVVCSIQESMEELIMMINQLHASQGLGACDGADAEEHPRAHYCQSLHRHSAKLHAQAT